MKDAKPNDTFFLETDGQEEECRVITSIYAEDRKKYYLIYESKNNPEEIYVSSFLPNDDEGNLQEVTDEMELEEIAKFLEEYEMEDTHESNQ